MIKVGLTGNMGSGKSTVALIFDALQIPVFQADKEAKKFLNSGDVIQKLFARFGESVFSNGLPDRRKLAAIVFNERESLTFLNSLIHPLVREDLKTWFEIYKSQPYVIYEAAILFESGFYREFDKVITVVAPKDLSLTRLAQRDHTTRDELEQRMQHQWEQERKADLSDFVIFNDENHLVIPQVLKIHNFLTK